MMKCLIVVKFYSIKPINLQIPGYLPDVDSFWGLPVLIL